MSISTKELQDARQDYVGLCGVASKLGYGNGPLQQLMNSDGTSATNLIEFFEDNPGAVQAVFEWIECNASILGIVEDDSCPGCGCKPGDGVTADCDDEDGCGWAKSVHGACSDENETNEDVDASRSASEEYPVDP